MTHIDWQRVAKPQDDGYDVAVLWDQLYERYGIRRVPASAPLRLVNGAVDVVPDRRGYGAPGMMVDHFDQVTQEELAAIDHYLSPWAVGYQSLAGFLDEFSPKWWPDAPPGMRGSGSGHWPFEDGATRVNTNVTVNDPQGCADGIYHEVGHMRLEALGLCINYHDGMLIANEPHELYESPVRYDVQRPMCAVIHGLYAWMIMSEHMLWCAQARDAEITCRHYLCWNIPKIESGIQEVRRHVRPTAIGTPFVDGLLEWAEDLVARGNAALLATLGAERMAILREQLAAEIADLKAKRT